MSGLKLPVARSCLSRSKSSHHICCCLSKARRKLSLKYFWRIRMRATGKAVCLCVYSQSLAPTRAVSSSRVHNS